MAENVGKVFVNKLPEEVTKSISAEIKLFVACLIGMRVSERGVEVHQLGTGTFIHHKGLYGILTAHHVSQTLKKYEKLGLALELGYEHHWSTYTKSLHFVNVGIPVPPNIKPDISVILLPSNEIGYVKSSHRFYDIELYRQHAKDSTLAPEMGAWCLCGIPAVLTEKMKVQSSFQTVFGYNGAVVYVGAPHEHNEGGFDYYDVDIGYIEETGIPADFGGVSGGSIWHVPLKGTDEKHLQSGKPILSGVPFYQTAIVQDARTQLVINSHGVKSIYEKVYEALEQYTH